MYGNLCQNDEQIMCKNFIERMIRKNKLLSSKGGGFFVPCHVDVKDPNMLSCYVTYE